MRLASVFLALALPACASGVPQLDPTPNVMLMRSPQTLAQTIGAGVASNVSLDGVNVTQWRATLTNAFRNSLGSFFEHPHKAADLTLKIVRARPFFDSTGDGKLRAHVEYQAELVDHDGKTTKTWTGTTASRMSGGKEDASVLLRSAVEPMYEEIAKDVPVPPAPPPSPITVP